MIYPTLHAALTAALADGYDTISLPLTNPEDTGDTLRVADILEADPAAALRVTEPDGAFIAYTVRDAQLFNAQGVRLGSLFNNHQETVLAAALGPVRDLLSTQDRVTYTAMYAPYVQHLRGRLEFSRDAYIREVNSLPLTGTGPSDRRPPVELPSAVAQRLLDNHDRLQRIASNSASKLRRDWGLDAPARPAQAYPTTPLDQCL